MNSLMLKFRFMKGMNGFLFIPNIVTNMCSKEGEITTSLESNEFPMSAIIAVEFFHHRKGSVTINN